MRDLILASNYAIKNGPPTVFQHRAALTTMQGDCTMADRDLPSPEFLRKLLNYDPETGALTWRERPVDAFSRPGREKQWNACWAGKPALNCVSSWGYFRGHVDGRMMAAHRVAWAIYYGEWPMGEIDHINGIKTDNRIINLRDVTRSENAANLPHRKDNTTGAMGVKRNTAGRGWEARIARDGRKYYLGLYKTFEEATAARNAAEIILGFHKNHGAKNKRPLRDLVISEGVEE